MDEVSYALEARKLVVPILLRSGAIPFRLRRVQHVDFTADYDKGFAQLLRALRIEQRPVTAQHPDSKEPFVLPPPRRTPASAQHSEVPLVETSPAAATRLPNEQITQRPGTQVPLATTVRPTNPLRRLRTALVLAVAGAIWGAGVILTVEPRTWWVGAGIVGLAGALTGLASGKRLEVIIVAIVGMITGFTVWMVIDPDLRFGVSRAAIFGTSIGAIAGAIVGLIISKLRDWAKGHSSSPRAGSTTGGPS